MKAAILLQWTRIFVPLGTRNAFWWISQSLLWLTVLLYLGATLAGVLQCNPVEKAWNVLILNGKCINFEALELATSAFNAVSDIIILVLPQRTIWRLQMSTLKKLGVSVVFAFGLVFVFPLPVVCTTLANPKSRTCTAAIARVWILVMLLRSEDKIWFTAALSMWTQIEITCLFIVYSLPALPSVLMKLSCIRRTVSAVRSSRGASVARQAIPRWKKQYSSMDDSVSFPLQSVNNDFAIQTGFQTDSKVSTDQTDPSGIVRITHIETNEHIQNAPPAHVRWPPGGYACETGRQDRHVGESFTV
jgi:hypothetical protein